MYSLFTAASVTNFFPIVVGSLGYSREVTYLLSAPPCILCCLAILANGFHSDKKRERYGHIVLPLCTTLVANIIAVSTLNVAARYTAMMLLPASFYAGCVCLYSWIPGLSNLPAMSLQFVDHPLTESNTLPAILPPKKVADALVAGFFDFGLTTSRFVHKPSLMAILETLYSYDELNKLEQDDLALVYMVLALGSRYSPVNNAFCGFAARYICSWYSIGSWLQG